MKVVKQLFLILFCFALFALHLKQTDFHSLENNSFNSCEFLHTKDLPEHVTARATDHTSPLLSIFFSASSIRFKWTRSTLFEMVITSFGWMSENGLVSTRHNLFSVYAARLARTIPDPRIFILSSRAHPPTY